MSRTVDEHLVALHGRSSPAVEGYNALRYMLERTLDGGAPRVVAVVSPAVGDGKTTTAINLAAALAHRPESRVLLVDADLRRPSVGTLLGLDGDGRGGLVDAILAPDVALADVETRLPAVNLRVLLAGASADDPFELLRAPRTTALVEEARRQHDFVVLDTAPFLLFPDSRALETLVDGYLMVVAAHRTPRKLVEEALNLLSPSKLIGLVFNGDNRPLSEYYGSYYRYPRSSSVRAASRAGAR